MWVCHELPGTLTVITLLKNKHELAGTLTVITLFKNKRESHDEAVAITVQRLFQKSGCVRNLPAVSVSRTNTNVIGSKNGSY
jgi:hypothetical protein